MKMKYFIGFILVVFGLLILLENLGMIANVSLWNYVLPLIFLGIGVVNCINNKRVGIFDLFFIIVGGILLAGTMGYLKNVSTWSVIFPLAIVFVGLKLLMHSGKIIKSTKAHDGKIDVLSIFSGAENKYAVSDFLSGEATAIFGGCTLDLSDVETTSSQCFLEVNAIFGGAEIIIPADWAVDVKVTPIFGGCENKAFYPSNPKTTLMITGNAIFGGIEVRSMPRKG